MDATKHENLGVNLGCVFVAKLVSVKGHQFMFQAVFSLILQMSASFHHHTESGQVLLSQKS